MLEMKMKIRLYYAGQDRIKYEDYPYETIEVRDWDDFWNKWCEFGKYIYCGGTPGKNEVHLRKDSVIKIVGEC